MTATSFTTSTLSTTSHSITAVYNGDGNFVGSPSSVTTQTVNRATTSTTVSSSAATSVFGQSVTFTATIGVVNPATTAVAAPSGSVTLYDHGAAISPAIPLSTTNGVTSARFSTATLGAGAHSITVVYTADANFAPSDSTASPLTQTVNMASTTTTIVSSVNPSVAGQNVTFTAQVASIIPAARLLPIPRARSRSTMTASHRHAAACNAQATLDTAALPVGTDAITAEYTTGDGNFHASAMSAAVQQVVNTADTTTTVTSSGSPTVSGEAVTFTATIAVSSSGSVAVDVPTGTANLL